MNRWSNWIQRRFEVGTSSGSACIQETPCTGMRLEGLPMNGEPTLATAAFTRPCFLKSPLSAGGRILSSREMAMWRGAGSCWIFRQAARVVSTKAESSKETNFSLPAGT